VACSRTHTGVGISPAPEVLCETRHPGNLRSHSAQWHCHWTGGEGGGAVQCMLVWSLQREADDVDLGSLLCSCHILYVNCRIFSSCPSFSSSTADTDPACEPRDSKEGLVSTGSARISCGQKGADSEPRFPSGRQLQGTTTIPAQGVPR
jgi:hypothetical protein